MLSQGQTKWITITL